ncbi:hypothetical protein BDN72DRAFT_866146 [Pluteus cervinus]|uniref:Uncharacterized protein n=1 Tax=Pluteus cervinus TaxID=181527 RepID=A0ACD2ZXE9_9AGAR|nr:hypothetical protein BDN72DRAFT_866146 [Pluteus cervinus]
MAPIDWTTLKASDLAADPTILLHKRDTSLALGPFDGLVGAVIDDGNHFITSPNVNFVYAPPMGIREVTLRSDNRFGDDDHILWPQPYLPSLCHFGAIRRKSDILNDPTNLMWSNLKEDEFNNGGTGCLSNIGHPHPNLVRRLDVYIELLTDRFRRYESNTEDKNKNPMSAPFTTLPMTQEQLSFSFVEVQRFHVELVAVLDYLEVYHPMMVGLEPPATEVARTIGVFTTNPQVCQEFHRAGLPVWFIRPFSNLPHIRINAVTKLRSPSEFLEMSISESHPDTLFYGNASSPQKHFKIGQSLRRYYEAPDPFETVKTITIAQLSLPPQLPRNVISTPHPSTSGGRPPRGQPRQHHSYQPYSRSSSQSSSKSSSSKPCHPPHPLSANSLSRVSSSQEPKPVERDQFTEPVSNINPPTTLAWITALKNSNNVMHASRGPTPPKTGSVFPEAGLFIGATDDERRSKFLFHWLQVREDFLFRLTLPTVPTLISNHHWRSLLSYGADLTTASSHSKSATRRQEIVNMLQNCLATPGITLEDGCTGTVKWGNHSLTKNLALWAMASLAKPSPVFVKVFTL